MPRTKPHSPILQRWHPLSRGLVGCWPFWEAGGLLAHDVSGYGNHGTLTNAASWAGSQYGSVLDLATGDGNSSKHVLVPDADSLDGAAGLTLWALARNSKAQIASTGTEFFFSKEGGGADSYVFYWQQSEQVGCGITTGGGLVTANWPGGIPAGEGDKWHSIIATYDGANIRIWIDGINGATEPQTGTVNATAHVLKLGGSGANSWDGDIAIAGIWRRGLAAYEVQQVYIDPFAMLRPQSIARFGSVGAPAVTRQPRPGVMIQPGVAA